MICFLHIVALLVALNGMDSTILAAIIGAVSGLAGAALGALGAWFAASSTNRIQERLAKEGERSQRYAAIETMILKLSEFAMQYPIVEKEDYCASYPNCTGHANGKERYENYCVYVFNTIFAVYDYCGGDREKINKILFVDELVRQHHRWWLHDRDNLEQEEDFRQYVHQIIDDLKRRGKIL